MIEMEIIEPSKSPYCAPLLLVHKKDGTHRPVIDFRRLNTATKFDSEPIPNPDGIFAQSYLVSASLQNSTFVKDTGKSR